MSLSSFFRFPKRINKERLGRDYVIRTLFRELLLRAPLKSDRLFWGDYISTHGLLETIDEINKSDERAALCSNFKSQKVLFMHIPKTAGTSFRHFFSKFTKSIYVYNIDEDSNFLNDVSLVIGHFGFAFMKKAIFNNSFTILRDPIERIISLYR